MPGQPQIREVPPGQLRLLLRPLLLCPVRVLGNLGGIWEVWGVVTPREGGSHVVWPQCHLGGIPAMVHGWGWENPKLSQNPAPKRPPKSSPTPGFWGPHSPPPGIFEIWGVSLGSRTPKSSKNPLRKPKIVSPQGSGAGQRTCGQLSDIGDIEGTSEGTRQNPVLFLIYWIFCFYLPRTPNLGPTGTSIPSWCQTGGTGRDWGHPQCQTGGTGRNWDPTGDPQIWFLGIFWDL